MHGRHAVGRSRALGRQGHTMGTPMLHAHASAACTGGRRPSSARGDGGARQLVKKAAEKCRYHEKHTAVAGGAGALGGAGRFGAAAAGAALLAVRRLLGLVLLVLLLDQSDQRVAPPRQLLWNGQVQESLGNCAVACVVGGAEAREGPSAALASTETSEAPSAAEMQAAATARVGICLRGSAVRHVR